MARYIKEAEARQPIDVVSIMIEDFIYHNHFTRSDWNGEMVYAGKDTHGKMRYFKWSYVNSILRIEAWMKGAFGGEVSIENGGGSKEEYRESIDRLISRLRTHSGNVHIGDYVGHDPMQHSGGHSGQNMQAGKYSSQAPRPQSVVQSQQAYRPQATTSISLILCMLGLIFAFVWPFAGVILAIAAKNRVKAEAVPEQRKKIIRVLSTVSIVISILAFLITFILPFFMFNYFELLLGI